MDPEKPGRERATSLADKLDRLELEDREQRERRDRDNRSREEHQDRQDRRDRHERNDERNDRRDRHDRDDDRNDRNDRLDRDDRNDRRERKDRRDRDDRDERNGRRPREESRERQHQHGKPQRSKANESDNEKGDKRSNTLSAAGRVSPHPPQRGSVTSSAGNLTPIKPQNRSTMSFHGSTTKAGKASKAPNIFDPGSFMPLRSRKSTVAPSDMHTGLSMRDVNPRLSVATISERAKTGQDLLANGQAPNHPPQTPQDTQRISYWRRRRDLWEYTGPTDENDDGPDVYTRPPPLPGAVNSLPVMMQAAFRAKMLSVFVVQLLVVSVLVAILRYQDGLDKAMHNAFKNRGYIAVAGIIVLFFLLALYRVREAFPINWVVLFIFSIAEAVLFTSVDLLIDSNAGVFACVFAFLDISIMSFVSGWQKRQPDGSVVLVSPRMAGAIAYVIVAIASAIAYAIFPHHFVTLKGLLCTLGLELLLMAWFSYDADAMLHVITPDEYMNGIIYFYTDLVLISIVAAIFVGLGFLYSMCGYGGSFSCAYMDCNCCGFGVTDPGSDGRDVDAAAELPAAEATDRE